ncbi:MAG: class I SAM-dependent methyltransferase [Cyanobacteria bacterium P01_G01_bin.67]
MQRTIEPELMLEEEQSQAYALADFTEPNTHFLNLFQKTFGSELAGSVLDIGCGNANITLRFAQQYPNCQIDAVDGSTAMLSHARQALVYEPLELQQRICLIEGVIPNVELTPKRYDVIMSNSVLHHLHNPAVLWEFIKSYGMKGTKIFIGDLLRPSSPKIAQELVELYAASEPEILKRDFYNSLLAAFKISEIKEQLAAAQIDNLSVTQISDRHVLVKGSLS